MASWGLILLPVLWLSLMSGAVAASNVRAAPDTNVEWSLPSQPLSDALNQVAQTAGLQIVFYSDAAANLNAPALIGSFDVATALDRLLAHTPLEHEFLKADTIVIRLRQEQGMNAPAQATREAASITTSSSPTAKQRVVLDHRSFELDEVRVTARRRSEDLQDTPVAVTAFGSEALQVRAVHSLDALAQFVPNVQFDGAAPLSGAAYNATLFIRGVGQNDFAIFSDPGVAIYQDGVYLGRSIGGVMDFVDVGQVEVLRGPQGTLFGRNTIGGAVIVKSQEFDPTFGASASLSLGNLQRRELRATLNVPVGEEFTTRISAAGLQRDGYATRLTDGEQLGDKDTRIARAQLAWRRSEDLSAELTLDATSVRQNSAALTLIDVAENTAPLLNLYNALVAPTLGIASPSGAARIDSAWITDDIDTTYASGRSINDLDSRGIAFTLDSQFGATALRSITAWRSLEAQFARDGDNTPFTFRETFNDDEQEQISQELQWSGSHDARGLDWVTGLYFFHEDASESGRALLAPGLYSALEALRLNAGQTWCGLPGSNPRSISECPPSLRYGGAAFHDANVLVDLDVDLFTRVRNRSIAAFGQATQQLGRGWSLTAGLRWTRDDKDLELQHRRRASGVYIVGSARAPQEFGAAYAELTPKVGVEWQATEDVLTYASYARGFKSGGFNGRPLVSSDEVTSYDPEIVDSYEIGAKTRWFDGRMVANAAFFYNDYRDMQLSINATPQNFVRNAGEARITGVEFEMAARLTRGIELNFATGYLEGKYTRLDPQLTTLLPRLTTDKALVKAPQWMISMGMQYEWFIAAGSFKVRGDYIYRDDVQHDVFNDPRLSQPDFDIANAYASFMTMDERWEVSLFGINLTDTRYRVSGNSSIGMGLAESTFSAPREFGAALRLRF